MAPLRTYLGDEEEEGVIISIGELMCLVILAAARGGAWEWKLVLYVSDNENTVSWLENRTAHNRLARYALRILQRLETQHHFQVIAASIYTKHNSAMDRSLHTCFRIEQQHADSRERAVQSLLNVIG